MEKLEGRGGVVKFNLNRPFPSSCLPPLQSESNGEVFLMKISFHSYFKEELITFTKTSHLDSL